MDDVLGEGKFEHGPVVFEVVEAGSGGADTAFDVDDIEEFAEFDVVFGSEVEFWFFAVSFDDFVVAVFAAVGGGI